MNMHTQGGGDDPRRNGDAPASNSSAAPTPSDSSDDHDASTHELPVTDRPQRTARTANDQNVEAATIRYGLEADITAGDGLILTQPCGDPFATATVVETHDTVARNAYPRIAARNVEYGCDSVESLLHSLNKHYPSAIRYTTPVTIIYYTVDVIVKGEESERDTGQKSQLETSDRSGGNGAEPDTEKVPKERDQTPQSPDSATAGRGTPTNSTFEGGITTTTVNDIDEIDDTDKVIMCIHLDPDISGPWFFGFSEGDLYRYHPYHDYTKERKLVEHRSQYALESDQIVTATATQSVLNAYQRGDGEMPKELVRKIRKRKSRQQDSPNTQQSNQSNRQ